MVTSSGDDSDDHENLTRSASEPVRSPRWLGVDCAPDSLMDGATLDGRTPLIGHRAVPAPTDTASPDRFALPGEPDPDVSLPVTERSVFHTEDYQYLRWGSVILERHEPLDGWTHDGDVELIGYRDLASREGIAVPLDTRIVEQAGIARAERERLSLERHPSQPDIRRPGDGSPRHI